MKKNVTKLLFGVLAIIFLSGFNLINEPLNDQTQDVKIITNADNLDQFSKSQEISIKFTHSLNLAGKDKIKKMAIEEFRDLAGSKGFTHLLIDEEASYKRQNEIRKRNYTVLLIGKAFK